MTYRSPTSRAQRSAAERRVVTFTVGRGPDSKPSTMQTSICHIAMRDGGSVGRSRTTPWGFSREGATRTFALSAREHHCDLG
jgi:hypothetical protein